MLLNRSVLFIKCLHARNIANANPIILVSIDAFALQNADRENHIVGMLNACQLIHLVSMIHATK